MVVFTGARASTKPPIVSPTSQSGTLLQDARSRRPDGGRFACLGQQLASDDLSGSSPKEGSRCVGPAYDGTKLTSLAQ